MPKADGYLLFGTSIDPKGFEKGVNTLTGIAKKGSLAVAASAAAISAAVIKVGKDAVMAYADFEQLVGGAQLMFGEAYDYISEKSKTAFRDVQMSQNDYLRQVNGFATGLKTSLNGNEQAAAELADRIVKAEADVVAATGNTQENIQNAFNGIMKSNFTMLDNLQIGITPTKEGFQQVIDKVNAWNAANGNATSYVIDNLADCQSALVDYIEMQGMSGYAAAEAAGTIQGSFSMVKATWEDLLSGLANPDADLDVLFDNLSSSLMTAGENLMPVIENILQSIPEAVTELVPVLIQTLNDTLPDLIPAVTEALSGIGTSLAEALPDMAETLIENLPALIDSALEIILALADALTDSLPELIPVAIDAILTICEALLDNLDELIDAGIELTFAILEGLVNAMPEIVDKIPELLAKLVTAIIENVPKLMEAGRDLTRGLLAGIVEWWSNIGTKIKELCGELFGKIIDFFGIRSPSRKMRDEVGKMLVAGIGVGISENEALATVAMENVYVALAEKGKNAAKDAEKLEKQRRKRELANLENALDLELITEKEFYEKLKNYRDKYCAEGTDDWYSYTEKILKYNKKMADEAIKEQERMVEKVLDIRRDLENDLKGDSTWYKTENITFKGLGPNGKDLTYNDTKLVGFEEQNKQLDEFRSSVLKLQELGNVPQQIFTDLADLGLEEGLIAANAILSASDTERKALFGSLLKRDLKASDIAVELNPILNAEKLSEEGISPEAAAAVSAVAPSSALNQNQQAYIKILEDKFGEVPEAYYDLGSDSADSFGQGFLARLPDIMSEIEAKVLANINTIGQKMAAALISKIETTASSGGTSYTYNNSYTFNSSKDTTTQQLQAAKNKSTLDKLRGTNK